MTGKFKELKAAIVRIKINKEAAITSIRGLSATDLDPNQRVLVENALKALYNIKI